MTKILPLRSFENGNPEYEMFGPEAKVVGYVAEGAKSVLLRRHRGEAGNGRFIPPKLITFINFRSAQI